MKKTVLHAAILALTMPMSLFALGLGEMTVQSSLDQPFRAEIELIDVGNTPLPSIKVGIADPEGFEQTGIEPAAVLSLLNFKIDKNERGRYVIKVQSVERMTEPYMQVVVDLTWPQGQLYKTYSVLLDPPGYQLVSTTAQCSPTYYKKVKSYSNEPGVIDKTVVSSVKHNPVSLNDAKKQTIYGPTITNENVWQIAQRYKTSEVILPQVVFAIVGANPDAFKGGNLNGLKVGVRLVIPSTEEILLIPADLATAEAMAHDKAWNDKTDINHVISPPYVNAQTGNQNLPDNISEISSIPKLDIHSLTPQNSLPQLISTSSIVSVDNANQQQPVQNKKSQSPEQDATTKAEIAITTAAVESVRESNALLMEQLHLLQDQNKKLQQQLDKRDKELEKLHTQMTILMKQRVALAAQTSATNTNNQSSSYWPFILLLLVAAGGGFAYWYFKIREQGGADSSHLTETPVESKPLIPPVEPEYQKTDDTDPTTQTSTSVVSTGGSVEKKEKPQEELMPQKQTIDQSFSNSIEEKSIAEVTSEEVAKEEFSIEFEQVIEEEPKEITPDHTSIEQSDTEIDKSPIVESADEQSTTQNLLEFETGLHELIKEKPLKKTPKTSDDEKTDTDEGLDFVSHLTDENKIKSTKPAKSDYISPTEPDIIEGPSILESKDTQMEVLQEESKIELDDSITEFFAESEEDKSSTEVEKSSIEETHDDSDGQSEIDFENVVKKAVENSSSLKSTKALKTLLDLAKTYIGMDDFESARHSLEEVLEFGNDAQKEEAKNLLEQIKDK